MFYDFEETPLTLKLSVTLSNRKIAPIDTTLDNKLYRPPNIKFQPVVTFIILKKNLMLEGDF
jgi:hypothetical protein